MEILLILAIVAVGIKALGNTSKPPPNIRKLRKRPTKQP
jgi:hypothetical protein